MSVLLDNNRKPFEESGAFKRAREAIANLDFDNTALYNLLKTYTTKTENPDLVERANAYLTEWDDRKKALELLAKGELKEEMGGIVPIKGGGYSSNAQSAHDARLKAIEEQRTYAEKLAEQARQDAIKNAYVTYDRSLPTYGQNAERLAQMGLSNSGHGDYLGGVAYSSMVGGIQDAHKTANKAIQDAYYNAELQKAQAADTLYNRQLAESQIAYDREQTQEKIDAETKAAYNAALSNALVNAGNGTMNVETALAYAQANGITDEADLQMIKKAANAYSVDKTKKDEETAATRKEEATNAINVEIKGMKNEDGDITFHTFETLKAKYGDIFTNPEYDDFATESQKNKDEYLYSYYAPQITTETTNSEIEGWGLSPENTKKLKEERDSKVVGATKEYFKNGNYEEDVDLEIDELDKAAQEEIYFENALSMIENANGDKDKIDKSIRYVNAISDKLTPENKNSLLEYANSMKAFRLSEKAPAELEYDFKNGYRVNFDGEERGINADYTISKKDAKEVNKIIPSPNVGDVIKYNSKIYVYLKPLGYIKSSWFEVVDGEEMFDEVAKNYGLAVAKPKHKSNDTKE